MANKKTKNVKNTEIIENIANVSEGEVFSSSEYIFPADMELLSFEQEQELFKALEAGDESAMLTIVEHNMRLVRFVASKFTDNEEDLQDLINEGVIGMMHAIELFDYKRGLKFSTYAVHWIRQSITRYIAVCGRTIRLPVHVNEKISKINKFRTAFTADNGREPTHEEISEELGFKPDLVALYIDYSRDIASLDKNVGDDDATLSDFIASDKPSPEQIAESNDITQRVRAAIDEALTSKEAFVIRQRYGLIDGEKHTLDEIGKQMNITRERVRQIEATALGRLRKSLGSAA